jgi:hypothetical protein
MRSEAVVGIKYRDTDRSLGSTPAERRGGRLQPTQITGGVPQPHVLEIQ